MPFTYKTRRGKTYYLHTGCKRGGGTQHYVRYCFRGSVEDWISIGSPDQLKKLAATFLKHLGKDFFYELY
jgi:hypothetical protein